MHILHTYVLLVQMAGLLYHQNYHNSSGGAGAEFLIKLHITCIDLERGCARDGTERFLHYCNQPAAQHLVIRLLYSVTTIKLSVCTVIAARGVLQKSGDAWDGIQA